MVLTEFESWALAQGQVGNPGSGSFPGQCVSLVQQYLDKVFDIPYQARGNAKDWPTNSNVLSYFDKVPTLQTGDIIVYGADYGGGLGHIGVSIGNGQILDQNGRKSLHVATGAIYMNPSGPIAYLRRKGTMQLTPGQQDKLIKAMKQAEPTAVELNDTNWANNAGLAIDTLWEAYGKYHYPPTPTDYKPYDGPQIFVKK